MMKVVLYTDGACSGNPGPGGYGGILVCKNQQKRFSGGEQQTTNNRMEILAAIAGLELLKFPCEVELYSDSQYLVNAMTKGWAVRWRENNWMRNKKDKAMNPDLWERLITLCERHKVSFKWVKGHADNPFNNLCDEMAVAESKKFI